MKKLAVTAIAFDLDGTLIDSEADIANALNKTLEQVGYSPLPVSLISKHVGRGVRDLITGAVKEAGEGARENEVCDLFFENYLDALLIETTPFEGVMETLKLLAADFQLGLVTNKPKIFTTPILEGLGMSPFFGDAVYSGDTFPSLKPDPAALYAMASLFGITTKEILIVGDSAVDIATGKNAGAYTAAVTYGFRPLKELQEAKADLFFDRFDQIPGSIRLP